MIGSAHAQISQMNPQLFKVNLNQAYNDAVLFFLVDEKKQIFVCETDLASWNIHPKMSPSMQYKGKNYYSLNSFSGLHYTVDWAKMSVDIVVPPSFFDSNELVQERNSLGVRPSLPRPSPGGFFNYYTNLNKADNQDYLAAELFEAGFFNFAGVGTNTFLAQQTNGFSQVIRLQSTWTYDNPAATTSLRIGDTYTNPGMWGQSALFGGLQWGTNFSTQPNFITYPLPSIHGEAIMPSTIDLYVRNNRISQQNVNPGPFTMNNIPIVAGGGNLRIVSTDILGRQQIMNIPYYVAPTMLKPGLQKYSFETGFIRNNFGFESNDYGRFIISGTDTIGITNYLTAEIRGEALSQHQTAGAGGYLLLGHWGQISLASATSHNQQNEWGALGQVGLQHQFANKLSFSATMQMTSENFIEVGVQPNNNITPSKQGQVFIGLPSFYGNNVGLGYVVQNYRTEPNQRLFNVSYSRNLGYGWALAATCSSPLNHQNNTTCFLGIAKNIGHETTVSANGSSSYGANQGFLQIGRSLPMGPGYGYNFAAGAGNQKTYQALLAKRSNIGTYIVRASAGAIAVARSSSRKRPAAVVESE